MLASRFVALQRNGAASAIARMAARGPFHCATSAGAQVSTTPASKSREWPDEPRVGVGVVVFRRPVPAGEVPEVGLIPIRWPCVTRAASKNKPPAQAQLHLHLPSWAPICHQPCPTTKA